MVAFLVSHVTRYLQLSTMCTLHGSVINDYEMINLRYIGCQKSGSADYIIQIMKIKHKVVHNTSTDIISINKTFIN